MVERRRETRQVAQGRVDLEWAAPAHRSLAGELVDISPSGFRVRHGDLLLTTGTEVRYSHSGSSGAAVVIWTRVFDGKVESGLYTGSKR
jgi:hypothetical protein